MPSEDPFGERLFHQAHRELKGIKQIVADVNHEHVVVDLDYHSREAPMVVICPDFPPSRTEDLVKGLGTSGFSTAVINYRGFPASSGEFTFSGATYDIDRSVDSLTSNVPFDKRKLVFLGVGYGAFFVTNYVNDYRNGNHVVAVSPITDLRQFMQEIDLTKFLEEASPEVKGDVNTWRFQHQELLVFNNPTDQFAYISPTLRIHSVYDPEEKPGVLPTQTMVEGLGLCDLLVVHGTNDQIVKPEQGQRMYNLSRCSKRLVEVVGANHEYDGKRQELVTAIVDHLVGKFYQPAGERNG